MAEVIDIDVRLKLDKSDVDAETKDVLPQTDKPDEEISDAGPLANLAKKPSIPKIDGEDINSDAGLSKLLNTSKSGVNNIRGFASNPLQFVGGLMPNVMNMIPVIALITAIISLPEVIKKIVKFLTAKGSPFDRFLKVV
ncbi:hypothetical protein LCGC14_2710810, partial [marine sediment metagenome]